jgi:hypothetical protein
VLGDVGHPQLVRAIAVEDPVDQIRARSPVHQVRLALAAPRQAADGLLGHDRPNQLLVHPLPVGVRQLGADPSPPVGPARPVVDLDDHVGEPRPAD